MKYQWDATMANISGNVSADVEERCRKMFEAGMAAIENKVHIEIVDVETFVVAMTKAVNNNCTLKMIERVTQHISVVRVLGWDAYQRLGRQLRSETLTATIA